MKNEELLFEVRKLCDMLRGFFIYLLRNPNMTKDEKNSRLEDIEKQMHIVHEMMPTFEYEGWCSLMDEISESVNRMRK